jgi:hypothetical protein
MEIKLDGDKMLTEIFELDKTIHAKIKREVEERLVNSITSEIQSTFFKDSWRGQIDEIKDHVLEETREEQEKVVKKILKDFYDDYRYGKKDLTILKKLKEFIGEN